MSQRIPIALRKELRQLAKNRCEYCLVPELITEFPHEPDHIIAVQHRGTTMLENLALACFPCNRYKGSNIASYDEVTGKLTPLFNPRADTWDEHFELKAGEVIPKSEIGRVTVYLLRFNMPKRIAERKMAIRLNLI